MLTRSNRLFFLISLFILATDSYFVWLNYVSARDAMYESLEDELIEAGGAFKIALDSSMDMLQQTALFVASDQRVQELFLAGKYAVELEGGGAGGVEAENIRQKLYELLEPGWSEMTKQFNVRQLHFHLAPGALSFLRVHRREKYGDHLDEIRRTVVDANQLQQATRGFEIGRPYAGIRGVSPVYGYDETMDQYLHIGAVELGMSFPQMLNLLERHTQVGYAVLIKQEDLKQRVWKGALEQLFKNRPPAFGYYIEASSDDTITRILLAEQQVHQTLFSENRVFIMDQPKPMALIAMPFHDYEGWLNPQKDHVGYILMWREASEAIAHFYTGLKNNVLFALAVFVLLEIILYLGIRRVTRKLEYEVKEQTSKLSATNRELAHRNTELKRSLKDLRATQAQLIESKKMASLAGLVAGVAHEINTPVGTSITAASHLIDRIVEIHKRLNRGEMTRSDLESFLSNSERACDILLTNLQRSGDLVKSFKQVAVDQSSLKRRRFDLCTYLQEIKQSLQPRLKGTPYQFVIECHAPIELNTCPGVLSQIITNLVMNSLLHGFEEGAARQGMICITVTTIEDSLIKLEYKDDGKGILEKHLPNIFEPFFTTNRESGGSGLGLNLVYNSVTTYLGGTIKVKSKANVGVCFIIEFPRVFKHQEGQERDEP
jgi:signal transduction histidine kinase